MSCPYPLLPGNNISRTLKQTETQSSQSNPVTQLHFKEGVMETAIPVSPHYLPLLIKIQKEQNSYVQISNTLAVEERQYTHSIECQMVALCPSVCYRKTIWYKREVSGLSF